MSATIVRSMNTVKNLNGKWVIKANTAESNVYPHYYSNWIGKTEYDTREEIDGHIIRDFILGNFRGGSRYNTFVQECESGVYKCDAWDSFNKIRHLHDLAFHRYLDHINEPKDSYDRVKSLDVMERIDRWERDTCKRLGIAFRAWKPCKERFIILIDRDGLVIGGGKRNCRYTYDSEENRKRAKLFTKSAAMDFCSRFKNHNPEMLAVA